MRLESMEAWRSRAGFAIFIGVLAALGLSLYAVFQLGLNGLAHSGCDGGGCEDMLRAESARYEAMLGFTVLGCVGLVATAMSVRASLARRIQELRLRPELPVATVTSDRARAADRPD